MNLTIIFYHIKKFDILGKQCTYIVVIMSYLISKCEFMYFYKQLKNSYSSINYNNILKLLTSFFLNIIFFKIDIISKYF